MMMLDTQSTAKGHLRAEQNHVLLPQVQFSVTIYDTHFTGLWLKKFLGEKPKLNEPERQKLGSLDG